MDPVTAKKLKHRLRRAQGQLAAIERGLDENVACLDLVTQLSAAEGAVARARAQLLTHHIEACVSDALASGTKKKRAEIVGDLMNVIGRQLRP